MKSLALILSFFISAPAFGQSAKDSVTNIAAATIVGAWVQTEKDSVFGHTQELKISFTKAKTFNIVYLADKKLKEQYNGTYEIEKGNMLKCIIKNKPIQYFTIVQVSPGLLKLKQKGDNEVIQLTRE